MTSDLQALFTAVVADPADDVARLVYADCLEEHGNAARAAFIRLQIEAERLHPDSNARAAVEAKAQALLDENWVAWWAELCAAVGFPAPAAKPTTRLGRLAGQLALRRTGGEPYSLHGGRITCAGRLTDLRSVAGFGSVQFRRGFPDAVEANYGPLNFLPPWPRAAPLSDLTLEGAYPDWWPDGPHLAGVRALTLCDYDPPVLLLALQTPHLGKLESLRLEERLYETDPTADLADDLARVVSSPRARQLKRLAVPVWDDRAAEVLAGAASLAGLEALAVSLLPERGNDHAGTGRRLATLARSPHLAGLKELTVTGGPDANGLSALLRSPAWTGLRRLELDLEYNHDALGPLAEADGLPRLDEFRLGDVRIDPAAIAALAGSPLLKRVRHFALRGNPAAHAMLSQLAGAVDFERIETFYLRLPTVYPPGPDGPDGADPLRRHFGHKLRVSHA